MPAPIGLCVTALVEGDHVIVGTAPVAAMIVIEVPAKPF